MSNIRKSLLIVAIIILTLLLGFRAFQMRNPIKSFAPKPQDFNALIQNVHWIQFDEEGILNQEFSTPQIKNFSLNNEHLIYSPTLIVRRLSETWKIQADFAKAQQGVEEILLEKNVLIEHQDSDKPAVRFTTDRLSYEPRSQKASTEQPVQVTQGLNILNAIGMQAFLSDSKSLKLGHVTGQYYPNKPEVPHG